LRDSACGQAARLQHQDALVTRPRLVEERERNYRAFAGARRGLQYRGGTASERFTEGRQRNIDGKAGSQHDLLHSYNWLAMQRAKTTLFARGAQPADRNKPVDALAESATGDFQPIN
jgi:hypothetical protein